MHPSVRWTRVESRVLNLKTLKTKRQHLWSAVFFQCSCFSPLLISVVSSQHELQQRPNGSLQSASLTSSTRAVFKFRKPSHFVRISYGRMHYFFDRVDPCSNNSVIYQGLDQTFLFMGWWWVCHSSGALWKSLLNDRSDLSARYGTQICVISHDYFQHSHDNQVGTTSYIAMFLACMIKIFRYNRNIIRLTSNSIERCRKTWVGCSSHCFHRKIFAGKHDLFDSNHVICRWRVQLEILGLEMSYSVIIFFVKLSLFLLYLSIFSTDRRTKLFIYVGITAIFVAYTGTFIAFGIMCLPSPGETWQSAALATQCTDSQEVGYFQGAFNVVSDFYILIIPIPVVWRLQMPLRRKIGILLIFLTGFL